MEAMNLMRIAFSLNGFSARRISRVRSLLLVLILRDIQLALISKLLDIGALMGKP